MPLDIVMEVRFSKFKGPRSLAQLRKVSSLIVVTKFAEILANDEHPENEDSFRATLVPNVTVVRPVQPLNAFAPTMATFGTSTLIKDVQPLNAFAETDVRRGILRLVNPVPAKGLSVLVCPILFNLSKLKSPMREEQFLKELLVTDVMYSVEMVERLVQPSNEEDPIETGVPNSTVVSLIQPLNALEPMDVRESAMTVCNLIFLVAV